MVCGVIDICCTADKRAASRINYAASEAMTGSTVVLSPGPNVPGSTLKYQTRTSGPGSSATSRDIEGNSVPARFSTPRARGPGGDRRCSNRAINDGGSLAHVADPIKDAERLRARVK